MSKVLGLFNIYGHEQAIKHLSEAPFFIKVKEYPEDGLWILNYNQIDSPRADPFVMECRSLGISGGNAGDYYISSRAFPRFFNYGELPEITGKFIFDGSNIFEKADGSLIRVWFDWVHGIWQVSTRGTGYAESEQDFFPTFREAILTDGFGFSSEEEFQEKFKNINKEFTYVFEYCSKLNRIVTLYEKPEMVLTGAFVNRTGYEISYDSLRLIANYFNDEVSQNVRLVKRYEFDSFEDVLKGVNELNELEEGFVCQDKNGLRIKIKASNYVKIHKIKGEGKITPKSIASLVVDGEEEEFLVYFSEYKDMFQPYIIGFRFLMDNINVSWVKYSTIENQKDFALAIQSYPYKSILFTMRNKNKTLSEVWEEMRLEYKIELLLGGLNND